MTAQPKVTIKSYFETGDKPTQQQFADLVDSYQDYTALLNNFVSAATFKSGIANITNPTTVTMVSAGVVGLQLLAVQTTAQATAIIGGGDMTKAVYDSANISEQVVGTMATQSIANKTLTVSTLNGATIDNNAWTAYTPTVTAATGTFTTVSAVGYYKIIGKTCFITTTITVTAVGSASNATRITLPVTALHNGSGIGRETALTGALFSADIIASATNSDLRKYDGTFGVSSGSVITATFTYEII